jgi:hypothetical protein
MTKETLFFTNYRYNPIIIGEAIRKKIETEISQFIVLEIK